LLEPIDQKKPTHTIRGNKLIGYGWRKDMKHSWILNLITTNII